jgi:hypothetical protein
MKKQGMIKIKPEDISAGYFFSAVQMKENYCNPGGVKNLFRCRFIF